ncbi:hypothetical protein EST38_g8461 [Candolleomyces aberdarensis]|uniref:Uncharacterized protein n=1 Tax=Candolleomyces aberdarensis TaxID=2316362 RepID=A0A4Q2DE90_9AGAR|nr:hypothetical protein EST38_g8461 [Candolleomyces aberdarensis]
MYFGKPTGCLKRSCTPSYWEIVRNQGVYVYSLRVGQESLYLPLVHDGICSMRGASVVDEKSVMLLILEDTPEVRAALEIGKIGRWAYPDQPVYHTVGEAGKIRIYNHLNSVVYAAVSNGQTSGSGGCSQYPVKPNNWQYWKRGQDEAVHVSLGDCIGAQTAEVFQGRIGKVLHLQSLPSRSEWEGMRSILPTDARYTVNEVAKAQYIGVKNSLKFSIYVLVLSSVEGGGNSQYTMNPGSTAFWHRQGSEIVLPTDAVRFPPPGRQRVNTPQFHGPHFICNMEGLVLEMLDNKGEDRLALPLFPSTCEVKPIVSTTEERKSTTLLILENTPEVQAALQIGRIGRWAYPTEPVYHTIGEAGQIRIYNHLDSVIYAAVSDGQTSGSSGCSQYPVKPNNWQYWKRSSDEDVHVSLGNCVGAQTAEVFQGRVAKVLHIQSLPSRPVWEGLKSVLPTDARYTVNEVAKTQYIGVKNSLQFSIYVLVLSSVQGGADSQYAMNPGTTAFWYRQDSEIILVSVGGAAGAPRAFQGKVGSTLQIDRL